MKQINLIPAVGALALTLGASAAFAAGPAEAQNAAEKPRVKIVATTFPICDWTREVLGDKAEGVDLVLLQRSGVDLHSYSPSAADLRTIAACDLFVFVGGESDEWTERALAQGGKANRRVLNLVKSLGDAAKEEKIVEGMEREHHHHGADHGDDHDKGRHEHAEKHDHGDDRDEDGHEEHEIDEHVWLSLRHASALVKAIAAELSAADPGNASAYRANAAAYCGRLAALDREYSDAVAKAARKTILVADRFPFRYLADDYGLTYFAAFAGCSAESEASFRTVAFLAKKADELKLPAILTMEGATHKIAETVKRATKAKDQKILSLDSLQSVGGEAAKTTRYIDVMKRNLEALKAALD